MNREKLHTAVEVLEALIQISLGIFSLFLIWSDSAYYSVLGVILFAVVDAWVILDYKIKRLSRRS